MQPDDDTGREAPSPKDPAGDAGPPARRFAGYRRGHARDQGRQATAIADYALGAGLVRAFDDFVDEGASGASTHGRPDHMALMDAVARGEVDVVVVEGVGRISRNLADTLALWDLLQRHGVALHDATHGPLSSIQAKVLDVVAAEHRGRPSRRRTGRRRVRDPEGTAFVRRIH